MAYNEKWQTNFPTSVGNQTRPTDSIDDSLPLETNGFPQFMSNDPVDYKLQNAFLQQLFSNDKQLQALIAKIFTDYVKKSGDTMTGDLAVDGTISAGSNISTTQNIAANGTISADSNITTTQNIAATGKITAGSNISTTQNIAANGTISAGSNISTTQNIVAGGTISADSNITTAKNIAATGEITAGSAISTTQNILANGTITAGKGLYGKYEGYTIDKLAKSGVNTDITSLASPSLGSGATVGAQGYYDNSLKVANTAYVQKMIGNSNGMTSYSANATLDYTQSGQIILAASAATVGFTITTPSLNLAQGMTFNFINLSNYDVQIAAGNGVFFGSNVWAVTSFTLKPKETARIVSTAGNWLLLDSTNSLYLNGYTADTLKNRVSGKSTPVMTALIDWNAMASANGGTSCKSIVNTQSGVTAYGGDSSALNNGDIILSQSYQNFDAILVFYTDDSSVFNNTAKFEKWELDMSFNYGFRFNLTKSPIHYWYIYGNANRGTTTHNLSTTTRFCCNSQNCGIIEIYGLNY